MKFREKLAMEHPERVSGRFIGGCDGCPNHYRYEKDEESTKACLKHTCEQCWNREIPDSRKKQTKTNQDFIQDDITDKEDIEEKIYETESIMEHLEDYMKDVIEASAKYDDRLSSEMKKIVQNTIDELDGFLDMLKESKEEAEEDYSQRLQNEHD